VLPLFLTLLISFVAFMTCYIASLIIFMRHAIQEYYDYALLLKTKITSRSKNR
jgi:hypothetical protein